MVPRPGVERTTSLSIKLSIMVKPIPLRSSPPVVNMGWRAFSMSGMPRPWSRTVTSSTWSGQMRTFTTTWPMESG